MQIVKEKIYMVNKDTVDDFLEKAEQQGFLGSDRLKRYDSFIELQYQSNLKMKLASLLLIFLKRTNKYKYL